MAHDQHIVSWDGHDINDGANYTAGFKPGLQWGLPTVNAELVTRMGRWPVLGAVTRPGERLYVMIRIEDKSSVRVLRDQLCRWFDPEDETPKQLVIEDATGGLGYIGNDRYVYAICEALQPVVGQGLAADDGFMATLVVHGDVRWRSIVDDTEVWAITATGDTVALTNGGTDDAYPVLTIEPTGALTGGYGYKRFMPVYWPKSVTYSRYPLDICDDGFDTNALVGAAKMQADGDDLRVWDNGAEIDRWLDGINTATTKVFCNLDFQAKWEGTILAGIGAGDTVTTIDVNEAITGAPSSGILVVETGANYEVFVYTGKNNAMQRFTGVTRAAKGTAAILHNADDVIWWCQHDLWILYGNAAAAAPVVDGNYEPAFELDHSTNGSWVYEEFGEDDGLRPGQWIKNALYGSPEFYGGNRGAAADPWVELGIYTQMAVGVREGGAYTLYNPCGITNANFTNGEKFALDLTEFDAEILSSIGEGVWTQEYSIPAPTLNAVWEAWTRNEALLAGSIYVRLALSIYVTGMENYVEAADCTITLDDPPTVAIGAEQGNYSLDVTIENQTTGDQIRVTYTMALNEELEVDTDGKTVLDLENGSSQFQGLDLFGEVRRDWLRLLPGVNTLEWTQVGTTGVTVTIDWTERFY